MSWDALADVGFVCDKTAAFCVTDPVNAYCSVLVKGHDVDEGGRLSSSHGIINSTWYLGEMVVDCSFCIICGRNCKFET